MSIKNPELKVLLKAHCQRDHGGSKSIGQTFFCPKNNNVHTNGNNLVGKHVMIVLIDVMLRISVSNQADPVSLIYAVQVNIWWHFRNGRYNLTTDVIALTFA